MASRESLIESHTEECESDDTILMSQVMKHKLFVFKLHSFITPRHAWHINKEFLKGQIF